MNRTYFHNRKCSENLGFTDIPRGGGVYNVHLRLRRVCDSGKERSLEQMSLSCAPDRKFWPWMRTMLESYGDLVL